MTYPYNDLVETFELHGAATFQAACHLTMGNRAEAEQLVIDTFRQLRDGPPIAPSAREARLIGTVHQLYVRSAAASPLKFERTAAHLHMIDGFSVTEVGRWIGRSERDTYALVGVGAQALGIAATDRRSSTTLRPTELWLGDEARQQVLHMLAQPAEPTIHVERRSARASQARLATVALTVVCLLIGSWLLLRTQDQASTAQQTTTTAVGAPVVTKLERLLMDLSSGGPGAVTSLTTATLHDYAQTVPDVMTELGDGTIGLGWTGPCNRPATHVVITTNSSSPGRSIHLVTGAFPVASCLGMPERWSLVFQPTSADSTESADRFLSALIDEDDNAWYFGAGCATPTITTLPAPGGALFAVVSNSSTGSSSDDVVCAQLAQRPVLRTQNGLEFPRIGGAPADRIDCRGPEGSLRDLYNVGDDGVDKSTSNWTTWDGCLVRGEAISDDTIDGVCGLDSERVLTLTLPAPSAGPANEARETVTYRGAESNIQHMLALPADAVDTGLRFDSEQLWRSAKDTKAVFVVAGNDVQRWPAYDLQTCST